MGRESRECRVMSGWDVGEVWDGRRRKGRESKGCTGEVVWDVVEIKFG